MALPLPTKEPTTPLYAATAPDLDSNPSMKHVLHASIYHPSLTEGKEDIMLVFFIF